MRAAAQDFDGKLHDLPTPHKFKAVDFRHGDSP
jgi:hypothetical protein